jgi:AraC-like DNA-binding protein
VLQTSPAVLARTPASAPRAGVDTLPFVGTTTWVKAAMHCRFNIAPLFKAAGLDTSGPAPQIRTEALVRLMRDCVAAAAPTMHFPLVVGELFAFDRLPELDTFVATSPTLRHALPALDWVRLLVPTLHLRIEESGAQAALIVEVSLPTDDEQLKGCFVECVFATINRIARLALGDAAQAEGIYLRHDPGAARAACERQFKVPVFIGQPRNALVFPTSMLDRPLPGAMPGLHEQAHSAIAQQLPASAQDSLVHAIEHALMASPALLGQGIERMAERFNLHPRTLQRRLRDEGQVFADIQSRCRLQLAVNALKAEATDIETLSERLGFADRHSFTRAFKRWTGLTPSEFRQRERGGAR